MKVKDLKKALEQYNDDDMVLVRNVPHTTLFDDFTFKKR